MLRCKHIPHSHLTCHAFNITLGPSQLGSQKQASSAPSLRGCSTSSTSESRLSKLDPSATRHSLGSETASFRGVVSRDLTFVGQLVQLRVFLDDIGKEESEVAAVIANRRVPMV
ncbi:hypothetical protein I7I51_02587 [Histoplasma capsulatum]|uniref:Uncharacterized protein n=1 Tax=Ajellomyces capsulatus TaxID=5037 RepID=A0A8A1ME01_AJECA|nr:hypothetical protein I7I51_02587 [Histoplasma capsulatum]